MENFHRKLVSIAFIFIFVCISSFGFLGFENRSYTYAQNNSPLLDINQGANYSSRNLYERAKALVNRYPDILHMEMLGESVDKKPIYALILTENVEEAIKREDFNVFRKHFFIEAGNHARETVNPFIVLKLIEDYCMDYYNNGHIKEFNLKEELKDIVMHFLPLTNPDGYDLTKFGKSSVQTKEALNILERIPDKNYANYKAGITGVDHNRNFPSVHYDVATGEWKDIWQKYPNNLHSYTPSGAYYSGPYPGSEPEVQIVMDYISEYDFRNFISFHSRGRVVYWHKYYYSDTFNARGRRLAEIVTNVNGYRVMPEGNGKGSGFLSDFTAYETMKPLITVETLPAGVPLPTRQHLYPQAYNENYLIPLYIAREGKRVGYHPYRLYVDNKYVRDYEELVYANAYAEKLNGEIIVASGRPQLFLDDPMTRAEFLSLLMDIYFDKEAIYRNPYDALEDRSEGKELRIFTEDHTLNTFKDDHSMTTNFARFAGIVSSGNDIFRPNDPVTPFEASTMIYNLHDFLNLIDENLTSVSFATGMPARTPHWAMNQVEYTIAHNYLTYDMFHKNVLCKIELQEALEDMTQRLIEARDNRKDNLGNNEGLLEEFVEIEEIEEIEELASVVEEQELIEENTL